MSKRTLNIQGLQQKQRPLFWDLLKEINCKSDGRDLVEEVIIRNYE